jgi:hypothetical protein
MYSYAAIENNVKVGDQQSSNKINHENLILIDGVMPENGALYINKKWQAKPVVVAPVIRAITPEAMRNRFTFEQRVLIKESTNARVQVFSDDLAAKTSLVNLDSPKMGLAMALLFAENIINEAEQVTLLRNGTQDEV